MVKVIVNGRGFDLVMGREISYVHAVRLSGVVRDGDLVPRDLTVTYRFKKGRAGSLFYGSPPVPAADGLVINVARTDSA